MDKSAPVPKSSLIEGCSVAVRLATLPDIARIARVAVDSLPDDPTFDYLWSYRHKYPEDNYFFWQQTLKQRLFHPRFTLLVATLNTSPFPTRTSEKARQYAVDPSPAKQVETIIAFGLWERNGHSRAARKRCRKRNTFYNQLHRKLLSFTRNPSLTLTTGCLTWVETWALTRQYSRRNANLAHLSAFGEVMDSVHQELWADRYPENFHLDLLCTFPDFRRRGAGTALTRWGIEAATREGAIVGVESSLMGVALYERLGFGFLCERTVHVDGDDETLPVKIMVYIPG